MGRRVILIGVAGLVTLGLYAAGCHSTTVEVVAWAPSCPPDITFDILEARAGDVTVDNSEKQDWILGTRHKKTVITVPPGSRVVVVASTRPRHDLAYLNDLTKQAATQCATEPADECSQECD